MAEILILAADEKTLRRGDIPIQELEHQELVEIIYQLAAVICDLPLLPPERVLHLTRD